MVTKHYSIQVECIGGGPLDGSFFFPNHSVIMHEDTVRVYYLLREFRDIDTGEHRWFYWYCGKRNPHDM